MGEFRRFHGNTVGCDLEITRRGGRIIADVVEGEAFRGRSSRGQTLNGLGDGELAGRLLLQPVGQIDGGHLPARDDHLGDRLVLHGEGEALPGIAHRGGSRIRQLGEGDPGSGREGRGRGGAVEGDLLPHLRVQGDLAGVVVRVQGAGGGPPGVGVRGSLIRQDVLRVDGEGRSLVHQSGPGATDELRDREGPMVGAHRHIGGEGRPEGARVVRLDVGVVIAEGVLVLETGLEFPGGRREPLVGEEVVGVGLEGAGDGDLGHLSVRGRLAGLHLQGPGPLLRHVRGVVPGCQHQIRRIRVRRIRVGEGELPVRRVVELQAGPDGVGEGQGLLRAVEGDRVARLPGQVGEGLAAGEAGGDSQHERDVVAGGTDGGGPLRELRWGELVGIRRCGGPDAPRAGEIDGDDPRLAAEGERQLLLRGGRLGHELDAEVTAEVGERAAGADEVGRLLVEGAGELRRLDLAVAHRGVGLTIAVGVHLEFRPAETTRCGQGGSELRWQGDGEGVTGNQR